MYGNFKILVGALNLDSKVIGSCIRIRMNFIQVVNADHVEKVGRIDDWFSDRTFGTTYRY